VDCDYISVSYSAAAGGATWNPGTNSTDGGNNTGWVFNTAPSISVTPSDSSSGASPTNAGASAAFTATATDSDNYYLAVCKTDSITAVNSSAPTCGGGNWCVSSSTASASPASCNYTAQAGDAESNVWYAFVCDHNAGSLCSSSNQGDSPFKVNHVPSFTAGSVSPSSAALGSQLTFFSTSSDSDTDTANDTVALYVCKSSDFSGSSCGSAGEWCHSDASASDPTCSYTIQESDTSGTKSFYSYIIDSHSLQSGSNPRTGTFTADIGVPTLSDFNYPTGTNIGSLPSTFALTFTLDEAGYCRASNRDLSYDSMTSSADCSGGGTTSISCDLTSLKTGGAFTAYISCLDVLGNSSTASNNTELSYLLPGASLPPAVFFAPLAETIATVQQTIQQTVQQITQLPSQIVQQTQNIVQQIAEALAPETPEQQISYPPIEESVTEEAPKVFDRSHLLFTPSVFENFVLAPLPKNVRALIAKFPGLENTFNQLGINNLSSAKELAEAQFNLPTLNESIPELNSGVSLASLSDAEKEKIATDIIFVSMADQKIGLNVKVSISSQGEPIYTASVIKNKILNLSVKPDKPAESVKGLVVFKGKGKAVSRASNFSGISFVAKNTAASLSSSVEEWSGEPEIKPEFILQKFDYEDNDRDNIYTASIQAPTIEAEYEIKTIIKYQDKKISDKEIPMLLMVDPEGYVFENVSGSESRVKNAIVSLYWLNPETQKYELWPAKNYSQTNPQTTGKTGAYSFLVPEGHYYLKVESSFFSDWEGRPFYVQQSEGIHINIELKRKGLIFSVFSPEALLMSVSIFLLGLAILTAAILIAWGYRKKAEKNFNQNS